MNIEFLELSDFRFDRVIILRHGPLIELRVISIAYQNATKSEMARPSLLLIVIGGAYEK